MATYSNVCGGIFKLEISCTSFLFKHTHNTINDNTNTCPQPLADLIWLNYRARKSGWFAINKRAKQLKQRPRTFDFQRHKLLAIAKNNNDLCIRRGGKREEHKHNKNLLPYIPHFKVSHTIIEEIFYHILYRNRSYHMPSTWKSL